MQKTQEKIGNIWTLLPYEDLGSSQHTVFAALSRLVDIRRRVQSHTRKSVLRNWHYNVFRDDQDHIDFVRYGCSYSWYDDDSEDDRGGYWCPSPTSKSHCDEDWDPYIDDKEEIDPHDFLEEQAKCFRKQWW